MSKPLKIAIFVFVFICAMGAFCAMAAGVKWGTLDAGLSALFTLIPASVAAAAVYAGSL
ncbi:hypothetical protein RU50_000911 [Salmonella enterica subsp. enterica]|nr:hypothetical protein [Salmonella enterica subsp. enterica]